jgi:thioredoxin-related protein
MLLAFLFLAAAQAVRAGAMDVPPWFEKSFLDFTADVKEAGAKGKRVMVYFGQEGCPYCKRLVETGFGQAEIAEATRKRFAPVALDLWGDRETVWIDGVKRSEKALGAFLRVQYTPTLLFLDEKGQVVHRMNGYQPPARLRASLGYASAAKPGDEFARYLQANPLKEAARAAPEAGVFREPPMRIFRRRPVPTWVLFESRDCVPCAELHEAMRRPELRALAKKLDAVRVDASGTREVTTVDGRRITEAQLARDLGVGYTPTLVFLGDEGREVFRAEGYLRPFHLESTLDYVASGAYATEPSFQRFIQARAQRERASGRPAALW